MTTADATAAFFDGLARRGQEPLLAGAVGSLRFDLVGDPEVDTWLVRLHDGDVTVSREQAAADCVARCDKRLFDSIAAGEVNAMAALLRGALRFEGDPELLVRLQRLFPSPPAHR